ncbi:MAG: hypothetical protein ACI9SQ_001855 [Rubritalea sp.]|jgi:hypothetical protein
MEEIKQHSFREIRQAAKSAQRREDALSIKQGIDPEIIQQKNSAFKENIFKNSPIKRAGKVIAL